MNKMKKKSYAKINLYLEVTDKRDDGYHILDSLICPIDLYDEIEIIENDDLSLQIDGESKLNINQCWEKLEAEGQRLLLLNLIDKKSMTTKQIAKKIKKPFGSVCTLLNRYKIQLYQCLKEAI